MTVAFVRQLGNEPGVQLNPLRDASDIPSADNSDQIFGIVMRATRGRIDKPFVVDSGNVYTKLGSGEQIRVNALNEAWVHVVEALNNGAYEAVVQRLVPSGAKIKYLVVRMNAVSSNPVESGEGGESDAEGAESTPAAPVAEFEFSVADTLPTDTYLFAVKHLECFNDGIKVSLHAEEVTQNGVNQNTKVLTLKIKDKDDNDLYEFTGSLDVNAKDDYGQPYYLPDVVSSQTDAVELSVGMTGDSAVISTESSCYGYTENGSQAWVESDVLVCFDEGGTTYTTTDYMNARTKLENSSYDYFYVSSGGTRAPALLYQLSQLAFNTNRQLRFDVPGELTPEAAIAFVEQLNMGANKCAHLMQAFWSPIKSDDPTGVNPKGYFGTATLNIAYACGRNAQRNAKGFAPKNYVVAGKEWPIQRTGMTQMYQADSKELSKLAAAKINPVKYDVFTGGGRYVFSDSLTCALVTNSLKKLIAVADMSCDIDDQVTRACKDFLQMPMDIAVKRTRDYLSDLFTAAEDSGWLVPSNDPSMGGAAWKFEVKPSEAKPYDTMIVNYWLRYDGTVRQIFVTQTLTR